MSLFNAYEALTLDAIFGTGSPATFQLGLSYSQPSDDGASLFEIAGSGYSRLTVSNNLTNFPAAYTDLSGKTHKRSGASLTWSAATGTWNLATHWFLYDTTNSRAVVWGTLLAPMSVGAGDVPRIAGGNLDITLD